MYVWKTDCQSATDGEARGVRRVMAYPVTSMPARVIVAIGARPMVVTLRRVMAYPVTSMPARVIVAIGARPIVVKLLRAMA